MQPDSTNVQEPDFGPTTPVYPELPQILRVTEAAIDGTLPRVYPALTQQFAPPLSLRDREVAYVIEPNNLPLSPAYFDCRLVGSYLGAPLYATTCCPVASSSSGSSSGSPQSSTTSSGTSSDTPEERAAPTGKIVAGGDFTWLGAEPGGDGVFNW